MIRKIATLTVIGALINFTIGCTNTSIIPVTGAAVAAKPERIISVVLLNGELIQYDGNGGKFLAKYQDRQNIIVGYADNGVHRVTPIDSVLEAHVEHVEANIEGTVILLSVLLLTIVVIAVVANNSPSSTPSSTPSSGQSCPFVYSYDGHQYRFEAEPLGGSTTEGLRRSDFSRMSHMVSEKGEYRVLMRNENPETQYIDQTSLLIMDHDSGTSIAPDNTGKFQSFRRLIPPAYVIDEAGKDVRSFFEARDDIRWQTAMPTDTSFRTQDVRHHLTFAFPKPKNSQTLSLYVNGGTAMWGSSMIREMLMLRGEKVDDWYRNIDAHGVELERLAYFMDREELFTLKVNVQEGSSWFPRGIIHGGGPMSDEDRIVNIDVSHVKGDTVRLQLNPPRGYWKFDCINAIEGIEPVASVKELKASFAHDQSGNNVVPLLKSDDGAYYTMPEIGDQCDLRFTAPDQAPGSLRSIYLKSSGYYKLHLPKDTPEQTEFIEQLGVNPGKIVQYSLEKYFSYRQELLSSLEREQK